MPYPYDAAFAWLFPTNKNRPTFRAWSDQALIFDNGHTF